MGRTRRNAWMLLALLGALIASGCSGNGDGDAEAGAPEDRTDITQASSVPAQEGGELVVGLSAETGGWDPVSSQWSPTSYLVANSIFDPLAALDENGDPQPYLAESIEPNEDFTEWTITLRPDVVFHDGVPLDADALVQNLQAHQSSLLTGQALRAMGEVRAEGPLTVVVDMSQPWSTFPQTLTAQPGYVASPGQLESDDAALQPVGTGPFAFENWVRDSELNVSRNDDYWRDGFPLLDGITYRVLAETNTRSSALVSGDVEMIQAVLPKQILDFQERAEEGEYQLFISRESEVADLIVALNTAAPPFDNPLAREAVATGLDRQTIADTVFEGLFEPAQGLIHPDSEWYTPEGDYPAYDLERARDLAQQYEQETGEPLSFTLSLPNDPQARQVAELGKEMLGQAGIQVELAPIEQTTMILNTLQGDFQATAWTFIGGGTHPDSIYTFVHGDNAGAEGGGLALAVTRVDNPAINEAMDAARATDDRAEQIEQWKTVQREMAEDLAYMHIVHTESALVTENYVRGVDAWEFPDGSPGAGQQGTATMTYQLWLEQ